MIDEAFWKQVDRLLGASNWDEADGLLDAVPSHKRGLPYGLKLSRVLEGRGRFDAAESQLADLHRRHPDNVWVAVRRGEVAIADHRWADARKWLQQAEGKGEPALRVRLARMLAGLDLVDGRPEDGWNRIAAVHLSDLPPGDPLLKVFKATFGTRVRTNSLFSDMFSARYQDHGSARRLADGIRAAIRDRRPFSLIRLGDGEGRVLALDSPSLAGAAAHADGVASVTRKEQEEVAAAMRQTCEEADVLGLAREDTTDKDYRASIRELSPKTHDLLATEAIVLTDCHCHYTLHESGELAGLLRPLRRVGFVGGRDVREHLGRIAPQASVDWHRTPVQNGYGRLETEPHFPVYFERLRASLAVPEPGTVFLVAAGVLGKSYCHWIKQRGGIAIDIGAVADVWSGMDRSRPYVVMNSVSRDSIRPRT